MPTNPSAVTEKATIDCAMIVLTTEETTPKVYGFTSGTKIGVEANIETSEAIKLMIKGVLKAQKPEKRTLTGHTITLTDPMTIMEMLPLLDGGELVRDQTTDEITGYRPPNTGATITKTKFTMDCYSAIMDGSSVTGYEKVTYTGCEGQPFSPQSEDDVFRVNEYTIISAPTAGTPPFTLDIVDALPVIS